MKLPHAVSLKRFPQDFTRSHHHGNLTSNHMKEAPQILQNDTDLSQDQGVCLKTTSLMLFLMVER